MPVPVAPLSINLTAESATPSGPVPSKLKPPDGMLVPVQAALVKSLLYVIRLVLASDSARSPSLAHAEPL